MAPRALRVTLLAAAIAVAVVVAAWGFPGFLSLPTSCPTHVAVDGRPYCAVVLVVEECVSAYGCPAPPVPYVFHGVSFVLSMTGTVGLARLVGNVTASNSTSYRFFLTGDYLGPASVNWTSPGFVDLVAMNAPYAYVGSDGSLTVNVTCGISPPLTEAP